MIAGLIVASILAGSADDSIHLTLLSTGASKKIGYYAPQRAKLSSEKPDGIKKVPDGLTAPQYAEIPISRAGGAKTYLILDEPEGKPAKLYVDTNGNGDLTDDAAAEWTSKENKDKEGNVTTMYNGGAMVDIGDSGKPMPVHLSMYRFDKTDPTRKAQKDFLLFYRDYAYEGEVSLDGKSYKVLISDENASGDFRGAKTDPKADDEKTSGITLLIDVNGNGKFESRGERYDTSQPFNIHGKTYKIADMTRTGDSFKIALSDEKVAEIPLAPDHDVGKTITAFETKTHDGKNLKFPSDYKGKVVLVDFWATWCGPCMEEMPNVVETYKKFHAKGFEIQGISLDNETSIAKMDDVMQNNGMTWAQVADGKGWKAEIAQLYDVHSIPATFLIDGTTGKILGTNLRGKALTEAVEKALADAHGKS